MFSLAYENSFYTRPRSYISYANREEFRDLNVVVKEIDVTGVVNILFTILMLKSCLKSE